MEQKLINTAIGGFPFENEDLAWLQDAYDKSFKGLLRSFTDGTAANSYALWGCQGVVNAGNIDIGEGYIFLAGELYKVDAHSITDNGATGTYYWEVVTTYDSNGDKVYYDTTTHQTYQVNRAQVTWGSGSVPSVFVATHLAGVTLYTPTFQIRLREAAAASNNLNGLGIAAIESNTNSNGSDLTNIKGAWANLTISSEVAASRLTNTGTAIGSFDATNSKISYKIVGKTMYASVYLVYTVSTPGTLILNWILNGQTSKSTRKCAAYFDPSSSAVDDFGVYTIVAGSATTAFQTKDSTTSCSAGDNIFSGLFVFELS